MYKSEKQLIQEKDEEIKSLKKFLERSYSEEEVLDILGDFFYDHVNAQNANIKEWFEQFKKK